MRNAFFPIITDPDYALARALEAHMDSYDHIVTQPSVFGPEAARRFREVCEQEGWPLTDPPIPFGD